MKTFALALVVALVGVASATAQYPGYPGGAGPGMQPGGVSPYLNLLNGRNPAVNYYGIVRPQMAFQSAIAGLQQQQSALSQSADPTDPTLTRGTGHPTYFNNLSHYYYNDPSQPAGARFGAGRGGQTVGGLAGANRGGLGMARPTMGGFAPGMGGGFVPGMGGMGLPTQR